MLAKLAPDIDIDAELDNVAFKRDGSPVYIGEVKELQSDEKPKAEARAALTGKRGLLPVRCTRAAPRRHRQGER